MHVKGAERRANALCAALAAATMACHLEAGSPVTPGDSQGRSGNATAELGRSFQARVGATTEIGGAGLRLRFESVRDDSRCPTGVTCVWEGDAVARLEATGGAKASTLELHTNANFDREASYEGYRVRLVELAPYPRADHPIAPGDYIATLIVERVS